MQSVADVVILAEDFETVRKVSLMRAKFGVDTAIM